MSAIASISPGLSQMASAAEAGTVQGAAALMMLRKTMDQQASTAAQLLEALPKPALASSGALGTRVNAYA